MWRGKNMMVANICRMNFQGNSKLFRHWLTKVTQSFFMYLCIYTYSSGQHRLFILSSEGQHGYIFSCKQLLLRILNWIKNDWETFIKAQKDSNRSKCWNLCLTRCWSIHVYKHKFLQNIQTYRKDWKSYLNEHFSRSKASTVIH